MILHCVIKVLGSVEAKSMTDNAPLCVFAVDRNLMVLFCILNLISVDKISHTTASKCLNIHFKVGVFLMYLKYNDWTENEWKKL